MPWPKPTKTIGDHIMNHHMVAGAEGARHHFIMWSPAEFGHTLELFFGRGFQKSIFARSGSKSVFRTHKYLQNAQNFETNPMGPVPGSETQISGKKSLNFLIGVRIFLGL